MMDCSQMYGPESFHPQEQDMKYDFSARAHHSSRTENPPKYYFIDFGVSIHYKPEDLPATICAFMGADKSVPEFLADESQQTPKHDPFAVDVYYLGNAFRAFLRRVSVSLLSPSKSLISFRELQQTTRLERRRSEG